MENGRCRKTCPRRTNFCRYLRKIGKAMGKRKQSNQCSRCRSTETIPAYETFKDGSVHIRLSCAHCRKFIKWLPHDQIDDVMDSSTQQRHANQPQPRFSPPMTHRQRWFLTTRLGYAGPMPKTKEEAFLLIQYELEMHKEIDAQAVRAFLDAA